MLAARRSALRRVRPVAADPARAHRPGLHLTPIQAKAIPVVLHGRDVMGAAQTGTGKTAAFSLPLLQQDAARTRTPACRRRATRCARWCSRRRASWPTRSPRTSRPTPSTRKLRVAVVFGGIDMKPQTLELKGGVEVLIATPGRLLDHIEAKNCVLNQVEYVVLDEADRMLDIGFLPDLQRILSYLPKQRQTLLFSATFSPEIKRLADSYLQDPVTVEVARANATATNVEQRLLQRHRRRQARRRAPDPEGARPHAGAGLRQLQARRRAPGALVRARRPAHLRAARRQVAGRAPEGARRVQDGRGRRAGRAPTSPRAASTSPTCRPSSTSTCRSTPRTTSTASAAPAAPAPRAWR